ncbi:hypothetical protein SAICODRAFT_95532 [Saitoella complicata NRRL Y-17804]|nr:uncharacterized protein SAICODRAFT_95532 [Saitoella complicata NRRL Y-17804]ODQ51406.1 hypothetical protein SAICODRAFT_95532 [Saitoella complicata NRRL Y-17804]
MPVQALKKVATSQNGVGSYILQLRKLDFGYCDWAGASRGMNEFLLRNLKQFAADHPSVEITVTPRPAHHPIIRGTYINGREKVICVRNGTPSEILEKCKLLRDQSGVKLKKIKARNVVQSTNSSVRGIWSPFHAGKLHQI